MTSNEYVKRLVIDAEQLLGGHQDSVADKTGNPPSGNVNDYFSIGRYCWPNPNSADGLPYERRDCEVNEEAYGSGFDLTRYKSMVEAVVLLALAYRHSGDERFAVEAGGRLRTWFVEPATRMSPHLKYAAALPGVYDGVFFGIIQGAVMTRLPYAIGLLSHSSSWAPDLDNALRAWFGEFVSWLTESEFGLEQAASTNNNNTAIWYQTQLAVFGNFAGRREVVERAVETITERLTDQIEPDGTLPAELRRPESLIYSVYCLTAVATAAPIAAAYGHDLWNHSVNGRGSVRKALDFLAPALRGEKEWPYPRTDTSTPDQAIWLYRLAAIAYDSEEYRQLADWLLEHHSDDAAYLFDSGYEQLLLDSERSAPNVGSAA